MGESYLEKLWDRAMSKLGSLASFVPMIAAQIKAALAEKDVEKIKAHAVQMKEAAAAQDALADKIIDAVADGTIDLIEGSEIALALENVLAEYQDVAVGHD